MTVWLNGALVDNVVLPSTGGGWLMGDGIFESLRTYRGQPFALNLHLQRLENSAKVMKFESTDVDLVIQIGRAHV